VVGEKDSQIVETQPIIQLPEKIVIHQLKDIPTIETKVNMLNCDPYNI
jgi:hypothetical protein